MKSTISNNEAQEVTFFLPRPQSRSEILSVSNQKFAELWAQNKVLSFVYHGGKWSWHRSTNGCQYLPRCLVPYSEADVILRRWQQHGCRRSRHCHRFDLKESQSRREENKRNPLGDGGGLSQRPHLDSIVRGAPWHLWEFCTMMHWPSIKVLYDLTHFLSMTIVCFGLRKSKFTQ